ncbi:hypothetical protein Tco_0938593 [Tanacetum coccineum]|uniref:Uncharacterized protein n=1 Tax=Tanacetum coccineum TaxID=301880 RepID=A0ABQ5DKB6_9ASTR
MPLKSLISSELKKKSLKNSELKRKGLKNKRMKNKKLEISVAEEAEKAEDPSFPKKLQKLQKLDCQLKEEFLEINESIYFNQEGSRAFQEQFKPVIDRLKQQGYIGEEPLKHWKKNGELCTTVINNPECYRIEDKPLKLVTPAMEDLRMYGRMGGIVKMEKEPGGTKKFRKNMSKSKWQILQQTKDITLRRSHEDFQPLPRIFTKTIFTIEEPGAMYKSYQLKANQTPIRMDKSDAWRSVAQDLEISAAKEASKP